MPIPGETTTVVTLSFPTPWPGRPPGPGKKKPLPIWIPHPGVFFAPYWFPAKQPGNGSSNDKPPPIPYKPRRFRHAPLLPALNSRNSNRLIPLFQRDNSSFSYYSSLLPVVPAAAQDIGKLFLYPEQLHLDAFLPGAGYPGNLHVTVPFHIGQPQERPLLWFH